MRNHKCKDLLKLQSSGAGCRQISCELVAFEQRAKDGLHLELFAAFALVDSKIGPGTSSRRWRSVARGYW
jgi:hypothetical protein